MENAIGKIEGLENLKELTCLYLGKTSRNVAVLNAI